MRIKSGFSLAEIVITLLIIGVVLLAMTATVKPKQLIDNKTIKYKYASAYDALNIAILT